jgi:molybdate transport system substrate-binding protein
MKSLVPWLFALVAMSVVPAHTEEARKPLLIAAAADLKFALDEVLLVFAKAHPEHDARATYGSSGTLFAQIDNGAPFDLFLSADLAFPERLVERGRAEKDSFFRYAVGHLVIWTRNDTGLDVEKLGERVLLEPSVKKVAIANPDVAPYGRAAMAALKSLGLHTNVEAKLARGENVAQAAQFAQSGAADAAIISLSLAKAPQMQAEGKHWEVPAARYPKLEQGGIICAGAQNRAGAAALRTFLQSPAAGEILRRHGFGLPEHPR